MKKILIISFLFCGCETQAQHCNKAKYESFILECIRSAAPKEGGDDNNWIVDACHQKAKFVACD
jgi:hypothetical protein